MKVVQSWSLIWLSGLQVICQRDLHICQHATTVEDGNSGCLEVCFRIEHGKASSCHRSSMKRDKSGYLPFMGKLHKDSAITIQWKLSSFLILPWRWCHQVVNLSKAFCGNVYTCSSRLLGVQVGSGCEESEEPGISVELSISIQQQPLLNCLLGFWLLGCLECWTFSSANIWTTWCLYMRDPKIVLRWYTSFNLESQLNCRGPNQP